MLHFDGNIRSCTSFSKAKGGVLRCKSFKDGQKHPSCPGAGLKGGGRSQNYIRGGWKCKATKDASGYIHKTRKARKARRSRK